MRGVRIWKRFCRLRSDVDIGNVVPLSLQGLGCPNPFLCLVAFEFGFLLY